MKGSIFMRNVYDILEERGYIEQVTHEGLKDWFEDGKITGIAYGNPFDKPTYGKATKRQNPFYEYREDGYLFIVHQDKKDTTNLVPTEIELLVLEKTGEMTPRYSKQLQMGGFDEELAKLRQQAYNV